MSIKHAHTVDRYEVDVREIQAALANLTEFAQSLPAPDENGQLLTLHYGHTGVLQELRDKLAEASALAETWGKL
mgnify:CR=1 FL=1